MSARTRCSRGAHGALYAAAVMIWATGAAAAGPELRVADPPTNGTVIARPFPGKGGRLGVGAGLIAQTSPYREARSTSVRPVPAISYFGDRVQILGPTARCRIVNRGGAALAATARYRFGAYDDDDSPYLRGLGDREDTLLGGLALRTRLPAGCDLATGYEHDLLDRTGGGEARVAISRAFRHGRLTVSPQLALNWLSADLAGYEYGVPANGAHDGRPAYDPGAALKLEAGATGSMELRRHWRLTLTGTAALLPPELTDSPLVDQPLVFSGFGAVTRLF